MFQNSSPKHVMLGLILMVRVLPETTHGIYHTINFMKMTIIMMITILLRITMMMIIMMKIMITIIIMIRI